MPSLQGHVEDYRENESCQPKIHQTDSQEDTGLLPPLWEPFVGLGLYEVELAFLLVDSSQGEPC